MINFKLRPFYDNDYKGFVALKNSLFPDHPTTVDQLHHNDQTHGVKIKQKRWVFEKNDAIVISAMYTQYIHYFSPKK